MNNFANTFAPFNVNTNNL